MDFLHNIKNALKHKYALRNIFICLAIIIILHLIYGVYRSSYVLQEGKKSKRRRNRGCKGQQKFTKRCIRKRCRRMRKGKGKRKTCRKKLRCKSKGSMFKWTKTKKRRKGRKRGKRGKRGKFKKIYRCVRKSTNENIIRGIGPNDDNETDADPETETETDTDTGTETGTDTDTETETDTYAAMDPGSFTVMAVNDYGAPWLEWRDV
jgi:hypothetical protein